jgi:predicted  nucleic acid-binding Zn-ribbon protein
MERNALLVLGMHRSGTSALTGALVRAGAHPGVTLLPATADNPEGYWECAPVVRLNDELLKRLGARWDSIVPFPAGWVSLPAVAALKPDAQRIIATEFGGTRLAVLKDPRLCRLLPFWREAFAEAGCAISCALMLRRPMEVAASLARRDQFAPEKSLALWLAHLADSERDSRGVSRAIVTYDALLADAGTALARVCDDASYPLKPSATQRKAATDIVRPDLRRQRDDGRKAGREGLASKLDTVLDAGYAKLAELAPGKDPREAIAALVTSARPALAAAMPPWLGEEIARAEGAARERAGELESARRSIGELEALIEAARSAHKARDEIEAALRARTDELALTRRDLATLHETLRAEFASIASSQLAGRERELHDRITQLQQELGDERIAIARLTEQIDIARRGAQDYEAQIEQARGHIDELVGQIELARQAHATRDAQEAALHQDLEAARRELAVLGGEVNALRRERDTSAATLRTLAPEVEQLRSNLTLRTGERDALAETAKRSGEAVASLTAELERRAATERELGADRARLAQLEREARERLALVEGQLAEAVGRHRALAQQLDAANATIARLELHWMGRLALRATRSA